MAKIKDLDAIMIFDSRGNPTISATIILDDGTTASASVPSGASTGTHEALELRDEAEDFNGLGVNKAIQNIKNVIAPTLKGMDIERIKDIDKKLIELDGTDNKGKLGANATLAVSFASVRAASLTQNIPLYTFIRSLLSSKTTDMPQQVLGQNFKIPTPLFNMIEGGQHADNGLNFQEYLLIPATQKAFSEKMKLGVTVFHSLKKLLAEKNMSTLIADEGGFAPDLSGNLDALTMIKNAVEHAKYQFALDAFLGIDAAANNFFESSNYTLIDRNASYKPTELIEYYTSLATDFSLLYLEDPFAEDDLEAWKILHEKISKNTMIVGDDLTVTNPYRLQLALDNNTISAIIIKPNQIGTVSEAVAVSEMAQFKQLQVIVSHRSGETTDDFIADFAVGIGADYAKFGAPSHERIAKYNRLLTIHEEINSSAK